MSTLQVATSNSIATATLKNGTGGGAPARDEDAAHLMEAVQNADRNALWSTSATPTSPLNVDFTWGSSRTIEIIAALNIVAAPGALASIAVSSQTGAYTPGGSWTSLGSVSTLASPADALILPSPSTSSVRSLRFVFTGTGQFALGRLWAGQLTDLGVYPDPDYSESPARAGERVFGPLGQFFGVDYGRSRTDPSFEINRIASGVVSSLRALADTGASFLYLNHRGVMIEARILPGDLTITERFTDLYDASVRVTQMV